MKKKGGGDQIGLYRWSRGDGEWWKEGVLGEHKDDRVMYVSIHFECRGNGRWIG